MKKNEEKSIIPEVPEGGFGGAATNTNTCHYCKHLVGEDGEWCPTIKMRYDEMFNKIKPGGGLLRALFDLNDVYEPCGQYEKNEDEQSRRENTKQYFKKFMERLDQQKEKLCKAQDEAAKGCWNPAVPCLQSFIPPVAPTVKIDNITVNINIGTVKKDGK